MTTSTPAVAYDVRELRPDDEPAVLDLLTASLAGGPTGERTLDFLRWKHRDNPFGASPGLVAVTRDGTLTAVRLLLRWELQAGQETLRAVRAVDTATHPAHQGRGLFRRLTLEALESVASDADLVFNTPNDQSRPGYLKMGWQVVAALPVALRPVRPLRFLQGVRSSGQRPVTGLEAPLSSALVPARELLALRQAELAELVLAAGVGADRTRLRTRTSPEFLRWRYGAPPGLDYRAVVVEGAGGLRGLGLGRLRWRGGLREFTLGEIIVRPGDTPAARAVLRRAAHAGVDHVATHLTPGSVLPAAGRRSGYLTIPGRGLVLVVNPRRKLPVPVLDPTAWALSLGDLELF